MAKPKKSFWLVRDFADNNRGGPFGNDDEYKLYIGEPMRDEDNSEWLEWGNFGRNSGAEMIIPICIEQFHKIVKGIRRLRPGGKVEIKEIKFILANKKGRGHE